MTNRLERRLGLLEFRRGPQLSGLAIVFVAHGESHAEAIERARREGRELDLSGRVIYFREARDPRLDPDPGEREAAPSAAQAAR